MQPSIPMAKQALLEALQAHTKQFSSQCLEFKSGPLCGLLFFAQLFSSGCAFYYARPFFRVALAMGIVLRLTTMLEMFYARPLWLNNISGQMGFEGASARV